MATLVYIFHPHYEVSKINSTYAKALAGKPNVEVRVIDGKTPIDVAAEQAALERCKSVIFQYPMYWVAPPSVFFKFLEEVLTDGWAYENDAEGFRSAKLEGKKAYVAVSMGSSETDEELGYKNEVCWANMPAICKLAGLQFGGAFESRAKIHTQDYVRFVESA